MTDTHEDEDYVPEQETPRGVGAQLRAAREKAGMTIEQVAKETRISRRHLENIELGNFEELPGRTYAIGFAKNYAKVVGLDQGDVADMVGAELGEHDPAPRTRPQSFEPGDPARVPSAKLGWLSVIAVVLLLAGLFFAARLLFSPAAELPSLVEQQEAEEAEQRAAAQAQQQAGAAGQAAATPEGPVVFTAQGTVWARFYDADGRRLMEGEMDEGDTFTVPADAEGPQLLTGRPDLLTITIGGQEVPRISDELETVSDVPIDAASLIARDGSGSGTGEAGPPQG